MVNITVNVGWKLILALGAAFGLGTLAVKLEPAAAERVAIHAIDAYRDVEVAKRN